MTTNELLEKLKETTSYKEIKEIVKELWKDDNFKNKEDIYLVMVSVLINEIKK